MNHERLWNLGNKLRASEGRGVRDWARLVMGIKEGTYFKVHWVLYTNDESWNTTSKIMRYWRLYSVPLVHVSVFVPIPCCLGDHSFII